jgi:hypothetical protein
MFKYLGNSKERLDLYQDHSLWILRRDGYPLITHFLAVGHKLNRSNESFVTPNETFEFPVFRFSFPALVTIGFGGQALRKAVKKWNIAAGFSFIHQYFGTEITFRMSKSGIVHSKD